MLAQEVACLDVGFILGQAGALRMLNCSDFRLHLCGGFFKRCLSQEAVPFHLLSVPVAALDVDFVVFTQPLGLTAQFGDWITVMAGRTGEVVTSRGTPITGSSTSST